MEYEDSLPRLQELKPVPNLIPVKLVQNLTSCYFNKVYKFLTEDSQCVVVDINH